MGHLHVRSAAGRPCPPGGGADAGIAGEAARDRVLLSPATGLADRSAGIAFDGIAFKAPVKSLPRSGVLGNMEISLMAPRPRPGASSGLAEVPPGLAMSATTKTWVSRCLPLSLQPVSP